ncbi:MAG TPA: hypothetical protein VGF42_10040 [Caulobacteraceae bacterium]
MADTRGCSAYLLVFPLVLNPDTEFWIDLAEVFESNPVDSHSFKVDFETVAAAGWAARLNFTMEMSDGRSNNRAEQTTAAERVAF